MMTLSLILLASATTAVAQQPIDVDDRLEPFVDRYLIDRLEGASLRLADPQSAGTVLTLDRPWEGIVSAYFTVLHDAGTYHMYYRGYPGVSGADAVTCYAVSDDGVQWRRPDLGLFEVAGTRRNNVVLTEPAEATHNFSPFIDTRPGVPAEERFKALGGSANPGLFAFASGDGVRWRRWREQPVLQGGDFDSQNVAFWSDAEQRYVCYYRTRKEGYRWVTRVTSTDFEIWSAPVEMDTGDAPLEHLYTSQTHPYFRAPHVYVATAARILFDRQALSEERLTELGLNRAPTPPSLLGGLSDVVLMTSRGGDRFDRTFLHSFVTPGPDSRNWTARSNYAARGVVPTGPGEMSMYVQRHYGQPTTHIERLVLRSDGFSTLR